jgi:spermidine/putrescine-binding protein
MKTFRKNIHRLSFGLVSVTSLITPLLLTGCGSSGIVFADYESYISPDLIDRLHSEYGTNMMYYSTNEDIQAKFKNSYDIAIPSTYTILEMIPQLAKFD